MKPQSLWTLLAASAFFVACGGSSTDASSDSNLESPASPSITNGDFAKPIDPSLLRSTNPTLSDSAFLDKLKTAQGTSAFMFFRTFPGAYHEDLAQVPSAHVLGVEGLCFGDAHPDNFGFLNIAGQTVFAFNDLDDSGFCPIAFDAARYFAAVELDFNDQSIIDGLLAKYIDVVQAPDHATALPNSFLPDWDKVRSKGLAKSVANDKFLLTSDTGLSAPSDSDRSAVMAAIQADPNLAPLTLKDIAFLPRDDGGSAGLPRYWLLVTKGAVDTILELKEAAQPGVELGRHTQVLSTDVRLGRLKNAFWNDDSMDDNFYISLFGARFLVRDRLLKKSLDVTGLSPGDLKTVLEAQVSYLAARHAPSWQNTDKSVLREWLGASGHVLAARWKGAFATH